MKWLLWVEIDEHDFDFPPIAAIDQAGPVDNGDAVLRRQAAARYDEARITLGNGHGEPAGHRHTLEGLQRPPYRRPQIEPRVSPMGIGRGGNGIGQRLDIDIHGSPYPSSPRARENSSTL